MYLPNPDDRTDLAEALISAFPTIASVEAWINNHLPVRSADLRRSAVDRTSLITALLTWAEGHADPAIWAQIVTSAQTVNPTNRALRLIARAITYPDPQRAGDPRGAAPSGPNLTPPERADLAGALADSYRTSATLDRLVLVGLGINPADVAPAGTLTERISQVLDWTESTGAVGDLVWAATRLNPGNATLRAVASRLITAGAIPAAAPPLSPAAQAVAAEEAALLSAFPTLSALRQMVYFGMRGQLQVDDTGSLGEVILALITQATAQHLRPDLLRVAYQTNPGNPQLRALVQARSLPLTPR